MHPNRTALVACIFLLNKHLASLTFSSQHCEPLKRSRTNLNFEILAHPAGMLGTVVFFFPPPTLTILHINVSIQARKQKEGERQPMENLM